MPAKTPLSPHLAADLIRSIPEGIILLDARGQPALRATLRRR